MRQSTTFGKCRGAVIPYLIPTYKALQKSKNARKIRKTEDVQTPSVSSFGFSIFKAPSMAPSTIGKYCSGQSFNFCPTRWRSSLSSRMTSGLKYLSICRPQIFTSCMMTGRLGIVPSFSMLARYLVSIFTFSCKVLRLPCFFYIRTEGFKTGAIFDFCHIASPTYILYFILPIEQYIRA